jgi:hypothetical protein
VLPNQAGRFPVEPVGIEFGICEGTERGINASWLRVWDSTTGKMLLLSAERADTAEAILDKTRQLLQEETAGRTTPHLGYRPSGVTIFQFV